MSLYSQLCKERDMIVESLALNERAQKKAWTMREVSRMTTLRINPALSEQRKHTLRAANNRAACHDPIRIADSRKTLDEWAREFNAKAKRLGYDSLVIQPNDHQHCNPKKRVVNR